MVFRGRGSNAPAEPGGRQLTIANVRAAILNGRVWASDHADEAACSDRITLKEVFASVFNGEVIETYPTERPYPSWLILGRTANAKPIQSVWACNGKNGWAVLIRCTVPAANGEGDQG